MLKKYTQTGATLFIGLILLLAISIVSLIAMRTSILDLTIANNKQQFTNSFEAAEQVTNNRFSKLKLSITGTEIAGAIINDGNFTYPTGQESINVIAKNAANVDVVVAKVKSEVSFRVTGPTTGWQLDKYGTAYHFQMNTKAQTPGRNANANHRVGFYIVSAAGE